ncbi:hypothetical protein PENSUB_9658 [Penicillium subrubescens]|uniref:Uncharacterized protein n=1 Tax=Penicillium subrubescens TaxID=1316194 RepID=A0A1Q5TCY5_9EURO|nr:hypothetical protein PENSUB_9658 [Penicillium subrubescens]
MEVGNLEPGTRRRLELGYLTLPRDPVIQSHVELIGSATPASNFVVATVMAQPQ